MTEPIEIPPFDKKQFETGSGFDPCAPQARAVCSVGVPPDATDVQWVDDPKNPNTQYAIRDGEVVGKRSGEPL